MRVYISILLVIFRIHDYGSTKYSTVRPVSMISSRQFPFVFQITSKLKTVSYYK